MNDMHTQAHAGSRRLVQARAGLLRTVQACAGLAMLKE